MGRRARNTAMRPARTQHRTGAALELRERNRDGTIQIRIDMTGHHRFVAPAQARLHEADLVTPAARPVGVKNADTDTNQPVWAPGSVLLSFPFDSLLQRCGQTEASGLDIDMHLRGPHSWWNTWATVDCSQLRKKQKIGIPYSEKN